MIKKTTLVCLFVLSLFALTSKSILATDINPANYKSYREYRAAKLSAGPVVVQASPANIIAPRPRPFLEDEDYLKCKTYRECRDRNLTGRISLGFRSFVTRHFHNKTNQDTNVESTLRCDITNKYCKGDFAFNYKDPNVTIGFRIF